jgi:hypothetical protein
VPTRATAVVVVAIASALLGALLAGCGGSGRPPAGATPAPSATPAAAGGGTPARGARPSDADELRALLGRRAQALAAGDPTALAATSTGAQRARDRRAARRSRALPLRDVRLEAGELELAGARARLRLVISYALDGADGRFAVSRKASAVRTSAGWRIAGDGSASGRDRLPWELADYRTRRIAGFVVLAPRATPVGSLAAALEAGRRGVRAALPGVRAPRHLVVLVAAGAAEARALTAGIRGVGTLAAISDAAVHEAGPARRVVVVTGQRLLVVWPVYAGLDAAGQTRVVTHELTHAALVERSSGRTPAWLVEGIALYASGDRRAQVAGRVLRGDAVAGLSAAGQRDARRHASLAALARPDAIARLAGPAQSSAYAYASAAAFAIVAGHGRAGLLALYDAFADPALPGGPGRALTARAVRRALHERLPDLERDVAAYAAAAAG